MASMQTTVNHRTVVLGKESKEAVTTFNGLFQGMGMEICSETDLPLSPHQGDCTLVVLDSESQPFEKLQSLVTQGSNKTIILNLEDLGLAELSQDVPHEVLWLSSKDPVSMLGILLDRFQGAYWRGSELVVSRLEQFEFFSVVGSAQMSPKQKQSILSAVLVARLFGLEDRQIQKKLDALVSHEFSSSKNNEGKTFYPEAV